MTTLYNGKLYLKGLTVVDSAVQGSTTSDIILSMLDTIPYLSTQRVMMEIGGFNTTVGNYSGIYKYLLGYSNSSSGTGGSFIIQGVPVATNTYNSTGTPITFLSLSKYNGSPSGGTVLDLSPNGNSCNDIQIALRHHDNPAVNNDRCYINANATMNEISVSAGAYNSGPNWTPYNTAGTPLVSFMSVRREKINFYTANLIGSTADTVLTPTMTIQYAGGGTQSTIGNVGIGVANPIWRLEVQNSYDGSKRIPILGSGTGQTMTPGIKVNNLHIGTYYSDSKSSVIWHSDSNSALIIQSSNGTVWFPRNSVNIGDNLSVGGTLSLATGTWHKSTEGVERLIFESSGTSYYNSPTAHFFRVNQTDKLAVTNTGINVNGTLSVGTNTWHTSTEGVQRLFFANSGTSYYNSPTQHVFRINQTDRLTVSNTGINVNGTISGNGSGLTNLPTNTVSFKNNVTPATQNYYVVFNNSVPSDDADEGIYLYQFYGVPGNQGAAWTQCYLRITKYDILTLVRQLYNQTNLVDGGNSFVWRIDRPTSGISMDFNYRTTPLGEYTLTRTKIV